MTAPDNRRNVFAVTPKETFLKIPPLRRHGAFCLFTELQRLTGRLLGTYQRTGKIDEGVLGSVLGMVIMVLDNGIPGHSGTIPCRGGELSYGTHADGVMLVDITYCQTKGGFLSLLTVTEEHHRYVLNEE